MGARFSASVQTGPGAHPASCTMGTGSFPGVKSGRGVTLTSHPFIVPWTRKSRAIPLLPLWAVRSVQSLSACTVQLYLYSPPMGRTACTEPQCLYSTAIPLLPLWAVRPVQSLSACTVQLYLYSPYGPYGLYRASVPVQYSYTSTSPIGRTACTEPKCLYSTAIPLLPLWAVRPVQSLSACTVQLYLYSPQCLYSTALPLLPLWAVRTVQSLSDCTRLHFTFTFTAHHWRRRWTWMFYRKITLTIGISEYGFLAGFFEKVNESSGSMNGS